jgi:hypothetical protein
MRGSVRFGLYRVSGKIDFLYRIHPFMHGPTLPVPIFVSLHFLQAGVLAYDRVHPLLL